MKMKTTVRGLGLELQSQMISGIRQVKMDRKKSAEDYGELEGQAQLKSFK